MSYSMSGLGQTKTGAAAPDHTAQDWATAGQFAQVGGSIIGGIIGATQGQTPQTQAQQQAQQQALLAQQQAAAAPAGGGVDWYWPVVIGGGLLLVGGIAWMMMSAPKKKAAPAAAPTANRRFKRNKHKRKARSVYDDLRDAQERALARAHHAEAKRRHRKRGSRKPKKNYAYGHISHPYSYGPGGRPRRNSGSSKRLVARGDLATFYIDAKGRLVLPETRKRLQAMSDAQVRAFRDRNRGWYDGLADAAEAELARRKAAGRPRRNAARYVPSHTLIMRNRKLSASKRGKLPKSAFVFPERRAWPIESAAAAYDAMRALHLGRVKNASDYMAITSFIQRHYPATWKKYHHMLSWPKSKAAKALGMKHRAATRAHKKRGSKKAAA